MRGIHRCIYISVFVVISCRTPVPAVEKTTTPTDAITGVSPNSCLVRAKIVAVDSFLDAGDPAHPCARVPCRASVQIEEVLRRGSAADYHISQGAIFHVYFTFTLYPTEEFFPHLVHSLPGLNEGDHFEARILSMQGEGDAMRYVVNEYMRK